MRPRADRHATGCWRRFAAAARAALAALAGAALAGTASAARISAGDSGDIHVTGPIVEGDYVAAMRAIAATLGRTRGSFLEQRRIVVDSPGGSVSEAAKLADLAFYTNARVRPVGECMSACFWILAAGGEREVMLGQPARLGMHNVYFAPASPGMRLSAGQMTRALQSANDQTRQMLVRYEVPYTLIDRLMSASGRDMYVLNYDDTVLLGRFRPAINQVRESMCSADLRMERLMLRALVTRQLADVEAFATATSRLNQQQLALYVRLTEQCYDEIFKADASAWLREQIAAGLPWPPVAPADADARASPPAKR